MELRREGAGIKLQRVYIAPEVRNISSWRRSISSIGGGCERVVAAVQAQS